MASYNVHVPTEQTRNQVMILVGNGVTVEIIGRMLGIDKRTVQKHYREELRIGREYGIAGATTKLWHLVQAGNIHAIKFWLANRAGWKTEHQKVESETQHTVNAQVVITLPDNGRG